MKKEVPIGKANRLINHGPVVLISLLYNEKPNIFTVAWNMPISHSPMSLAIACGNSNYSTEGIKESCEFVINIPDLSLKEKVIQCGKSSGRDKDKFSEFNLTPLDSQKIKAFGIQECIGHMECIVSKTIEHTDHTIFLAKVVCAVVDEDKWNFQENIWQIDKAEILHHLGGPNFGITKSV